MKHSNSPLWGSVSILIGVVIAILALVRGDWLLPLLIAAFAVWGLWLVLRVVLPVQRENRFLRRQEQRAQRERDEWNEAGVTCEGVMKTLLRHVSYRISAALRSAYPNASWEWTMENPALFAAQGGTGRIRIFGSPDYEYADVTLEGNANMSVTLLKTAPLQEKPEAEQQNKQPAMNPQTWFETQAKDPLLNLITDLNTRGHSKLFLKENGEVCIQPVNGGDDIPQHKLPDFPAKVYWPKLIDVLAQAGLTATPLEDRIQVAW